MESRKIRSVSSYKSNFDNFLKVVACTYLLSSLLLMIISRELLFGIFMVLRHIKRNIEAPASVESEIV